MKFSVFSNVYNEIEYIKYWLDKVYSHVDEIVLVEGTFAPHTKHTNEPHSQGMAKTNVRSNDGTLEFIQNYPDPDKKIKLLQSKGDQIDCMNLGISNCTGDFILITDIDEFYLDINKLKNIVSNNRQYDAFTADFREFYFDKYHYMMNPSKVLMCIRNFEGVKFLKSRTINAKTYKHIEPFCFHYSYLRSAERIREKMLPYGEKGKKWFDNVYTTYTQTKSLEKVYKMNNNSVHLLFPNKRLIEYNDKHPDVLVEHPLFKEEKIVLSALIPSYNRLKYLMMTLQHIFDNTKVPYEIIVVDDGSPDKNVRRYLRQIEGTNNIKVFFNEEGLGFVKTMDRAIRESKGEYLAILNNDLYVQPGWDTHAIEMMENDETIGMTGFKLFFQDNKIQTCGWKRDNDKVSGFLHEGKDRYASDVLNDENVLYAPLGIIRRSAYYDIGGLDCRFNMGWSDVDTGIRLNLLGLKVKYCSASECLHIYPEESRAHFYNDDMWLFRQKHPNWRTVMNGLSGIVGGQDYNNIPKDMGSVDILIITNNRLRYTQKCFEYLRKNTHYKNVRFYVVDNASTDGTIEYLKKQDWIYSLQLNKENMSISIVTNEFWKKSKAQFVCKVDNDGLVGRRWLTKLLEAYPQIPNIAVLSAFHFLPTDLNYMQSEHLIETYGNTAILRQKFVGGICYIMDRKIVKQNGLQAGKTKIYGWTEYQSMLHGKGYKNGYLYPCSYVVNLDDPRNNGFDSSEENLARLREVFKIRGMNGKPETIARWYKQDAKKLLEQKL